MNMDFPDADGIDSTCDRKHREEDVPDAVAPRCNGETVAYVHKPDGTRLYLCEDHYLELLRFPADDEERLRDMDYNELRSLAAERGINLQSPSRDDLIDRMAERKDPAELPEVPRAKLCPECRKVTLLDEFDRVADRCYGCVGERPEIELDPYRR